MKTDWAIPTDYASPPGDRPGQRGGGPFLYAGGSRPLGGYSINGGVGSGGFGESLTATSDAGRNLELISLESR